MRARVALAEVIWLEDAVDGESHREGVKREREPAEEEHEQQQRPDGGVDPHGVQDRGTRGCRGQRGEPPDVADRRHEPHRDRGAEQEAQEVGRHDRAGDGEAEPLEFGPDAQHRALQAVADHEEHHAEGVGARHGLRCRP